LTGKGDKPAHLEVWRLRDGKRRVLNVQSDLLDISTFVVIPLARPGSFDRVDEVNPHVEVSGATYLLVTQQLSAVRRSDMRTRVADLSSDSGMVIKALDRLLTTS
jgi:toxin CcdB